MIRRNRDITIFSLSAIDLFCSGMGAVMVLMLILMPYYQRPDVRVDDSELIRLRAELAQMEANLSQSQADLAQAVAELARASEELADLRAREITPAIPNAAERIAELERAIGEMRGRLANPFLVVIISWDNEQADVDLHITDPQNRRFFYRQRRHGGSPAYIEVDSINGPGNEVWIHPAATPGTYKVEYVYFSDRRRTGPVNIRGVAIYQGGRLEFPVRRINTPSESRAVFAANLVVTPDGEVVVR
jgi:hypothetical protein